LRKEPERRYASVEQFSEDIRRYLEGYPVLARPATRAYALRKLAGRNKAMGIAAALLLLTLAAGVGATLRQARIANERFNDARQMAHSFLFDYHDAIVALPGAIELRRKLVQDGLVYLDRLSKQAGGDAGLQLELAGGYMKVADVQASANGDNLGDVRGGQVSYRKAIALLEELNRRDPANQEIQELLGMADRFYGQLSQQAGDPRTAADRVRKGIALFERLCANGQYKMKQTLYSGSRYFGMDDRRNVLSGSYVAMGRVMGDPSVPNLGNQQEAERWYRRNIAFLESLPPDKNRLGAIGFNHGYLATLKSYAGDYQGELAETRKAVEIKLRVIQMPPVTQFDRRELAIAYSNVGVGLLDTGDFASALDNFQLAGHMFESMIAADPDNAELRTTMTNNTRRVAETLSKLKRYTEASAIFQRVIGVYQELAVKDPGNAALQARLGQAYIGLSIMHSNAGNGPATSRAAGLAEKILTPLGGGDPAAHQLLARSYFLSGKGQELTGNWTAAYYEYQRSLQLWHDLRSKGQLSAFNVLSLTQAEQAVAAAETKSAATALTAR
ncbi:MAG TPA: hypothetical protein VNV82_24145, partial [Bryobacteraceae bacterium]|nr:hypothetical protein [Bryobacteraceae bacterium]